jgi:hypothetical protein
VKARRFAMRCLVGFGCVLAALVVSPLSASAQAGEEGATSEPTLQLVALDSTGVVFTLIPSADEQYRPELERKARKTRNALIGTLAVAVVGSSLFGIAQTQRVECPPRKPLDFDATTRCYTTAGDNLVVAGAIITFPALTGAFITGIMFGVQKGKLRRMKEARYERPRRVQWDLAGSRVVF